MEDKKSAQERRVLFDEAWARCEVFLRAAQAAYTSRTAGPDQPVGAAHPTNPSLLSSAFRERLRGVLRIPAIEALFPAPWTVAARRVLPSASPQYTATAMWGPVLGWCVLELLAESIDVENPERVALDLFDRLRLREPFAQAFAALGFEGEEAWRVAARIKVELLTSAGIGKEEEASPEAETAASAQEEAPQPAAATPPAADDEKVALSPALWLDPDVRWLTGVHEAEGHDYLVRESYEELLWWLLMPSLLRLAGEAAPGRAAVEQMSRTVDEALATAEAAEYRVDMLLGPADGEAPLAEPGSETVEPEPPEVDAEDLQAELNSREGEIEAPSVSAANPVKPA